MLDTTIVSSTTSVWLRRLGLVVAALLVYGVAGYSLLNALLPAIRNDFVSALYARAPVSAFLHMGFGGLALALGLPQMFSRLRAARPGLHRRIGQIYVGCVALSGSAGLLMALAASGGLSARVGFGMMAAGWLWCTGCAFLHARARRIDQHRVWMLRSYALTLAAVSLRLYLGLFGVMGLSFQQVYPLLAWLCWVPHLLFVDWWLLRRRLATVPPRAT